MQQWKIRDEKSADEAGIYEVNAAAFGRPAEAELVQRLHALGAVTLSLVAVEENGRVVGHALFSPMTVVGESGAETAAVGLGPVAVLPERQGQGIGTALIAAGLAGCRGAGHTAVIVLGHPSYYPRFGFQPASRYGITNMFGAPEEAFLVLELIPGALNDAAGVAHYHPAFAEVS